MNHEPNLLLEPNFYPQQDALFAELMSTVSWDKRMKSRKTASFSKPYNDSQLTYEPAELLPCLIPLRDLLIGRLKIPLNNCLLNLYETGKNSMGFHSDETKHLLPGSGVAIVSLGSERKITFRSIDRSESVDYKLTAGSLLYMGADVQQAWSHGIKKCDEAESRISLTWRAIS